MTRDPHQQNPSPDEQQLIAFHLGEPFASPAAERDLRARLEHDTAFAALSEDIAHTLRVFSAEPIPPPNVEAAWQRLRANLPPSQQQQKRLSFSSGAFGHEWFLPTLAGALALLLVAAGAIALRHHNQPQTPSDTAGVVPLRPSAPGVTIAGEADHLDRAERWLTTVNHSTEPLDPATRAQGQQLLADNAVYLQNARAHGDLTDAAVLDRLDRVLTTSNHPAEAGLQLRLDMNTDGLLFQIRILRQNQDAPIGDSQ